MIIATAGHVDHGKTHLLQALTGINTDRLPEEQKRGLTIDLGYAFMPYYSAQTQQQETLGFIDVPGHEKFLSNMLAGVGTAHHAMLIVAGDEGMMAQSYEHLVILRLLAMDSLTVVITKSDLTTLAQQQQLEAQLTQLLFQQGFTEPKIFHCSAFTGDGIDELKTHLIALADNEKQQQNDLGFRLAIDRAFHVKGAGLVVTGTALSGNVKVGDSLSFVSHNKLKQGQTQAKNVRIKGLHAQGNTAQVATSNQRVAMNIVGDIDKDELSRGDWLVNIVPGVVINRVTMTLTANTDIRHWQAVQVFHAAAHTTGRIALLETDKAKAGEHVLAEITFDSPLCLAEQDRLLLRDPALKTNLGSGVVIDLLPPNRGKRKPERLTYLTQRAELDSIKDIISFKLENKPQSISELTWQHQNQHIEQIAASNVKNDITQYGDFLCTSAYQAQLQLHIIEKLTQYHQQENDHIGLGKDRLYRIAALNQPAAIFNELLAQLLAQQSIINTRGWLHLASHQLQLTELEQKSWQHIAQIMQQNPTPWWVRDLANECDFDEDELRSLSYKLAQLGYISAIVKDRYVSHDYLISIANRVREHIEHHQKLETAEFRTISQLGRKVAIQILEYFDKIGFTKRKFNYRELRDEALLKE
ncbi:MULTISPECIES: selenocysteine-specific translation elongation factor [unclassified Photobacterium]|uniref:selenocysteine-specific translation elongation factor n=1 Tax=unclassified Photobacterium TaxID=2628852 RepID=UPI001EDCCD51|nr:MULTISPECIES: selenocysteine-specific translation elongation factor [unclassified Photobacterium]MCG3863141.1 selenocysteine-specific translation elongation factor [Photobacterium sp. Ph6]MCG3874671.1 selenocysteine-specific translation elongation factor [Photobacterium sp. Ph5]